MAFDKRIAAEDVAVLPDSQAVIRHIFSSLGTDTALEADIRRIARQIGANIPDLTAFCERLANGRLRLKHV